MRRRWGAPRWSGGLGSAAIAVMLVVTGACSDDDPAPDAASSEESTSSTTTTAPEEEESVEVREYRSRPDLTPPLITVDVDETDTPGLLFLAPKQVDAQTGPLIVDDAGDVVWSLPVGERASAADFRVQTYQGRPVLTWWEGISHRGWGEGEFVIADETYTEIARFKAGNGRQGDLHELQLTEDGTALVLVYEKEERDLTEVDGPAEGWQFENFVQEIDVATGEVLLEWAASDHVDMDESYVELDEEEDGSEEGAYDWFHVNSASLWDDDTIIISARNTHAVYAIDRATGEVEWRLGGRRSDFELDDGAVFGWQHDARRQPDGTLSLFDNWANEDDEPDSRALFLRIDEAARTASVAREQAHPDGVRSRTQGNTVLLPGGGLLVGWGNQGRVSEFNAAGTLIYDASWAPADSYRVYRLPWIGRPTTPVDVVAERSSNEEAELSISWNGATEVRSWRISGGDDAPTVTELATADKTGFETVVTVPARPTFVVEALDAAGQVLGRGELALG